MTTAGDLMTPGAECVSDTDTLNEAARKMRDYDVASLPICGHDGRLVGMLSDRDIVVKALAEGADPATVTAGSLAEGKPATIDAGDSVEEAIETMKAYEVRRIPVVEHETLVGMLEHDDLANALPPEMVSELFDELSG